MSVPVVYATAESGRRAHNEAGIALIMALFMLTWLSLLGAALAQEIVLGLRINRYANQGASYQQAAESALQEGAGHISKLVSFVQPDTSTAFIGGQNERIYNASALDYVHTVEPKQWHKSAAGSGSYLLEYVATRPLTAAEQARLPEPQATEASAFLFRITAYAAGPEGRPVVVLQSNYRKVFLTSGAPASIPATRQAFRSLPVEIL